MEGQGPSRFVIKLSIVIVIVALAYGAGKFWTLYTSLQSEQHRISEKEALFQANRVKLSERLSRIAGITPRDITNGFWYSWRDAEGNEHLFFANLDSLAALDLSDAQIQELISRIAGSTIISTLAARSVPESDLPPPLQFHNKLYSFTGDGSFISTEKALKSVVASGTPTSEELFELSYLSELKGDYATRDKLDARNCTLYKARCKTNMSTITVKGRVVDTKGSPVQGARVGILSRPEVKSVATDDKGEFVLSAAINEIEKVRVSATKRNYSDGVASVVSVTKGKSNYKTEDIVLSSPINIVTIDISRKTVSDPNSSISADGTITIRTPYSTYTIPPKTIIDKNKKLYTGVVDVYLYEFTKDTVPSGLMRVDTFDQVMGYAGNAMQSFGMPYIQFFGPDSQELHVLKSNPLSLTYRITDMASLRTNDVGTVHGKLTDADMQLLVQASQGQPYRIDRQFLIDNQVLQFPAFWVYDRKAGIWENVGVTVLDTEGTIRTPFYTINDMR